MRILIFVILKALEFGTVVFFPHYLGKLLCKYKRVEWIRKEIDDAPYWVMGFMFIVVVLVICIIGCANWKWAGAFIPE